MPVITILTPFRNSAAYILETAESIFRQSFKDWEWILVNDHSEQNEEELLRDVLSDPRVKYLRNKGRGICEALITGFDLAQGTYITRMDADDVMPERKLELFLSALTGSDADIVTGKVRYFSASGEISPGYLKYEAWLNERVDLQDFYTEIYRECTLSSGNWMMRTELLSQSGGFEGLVYPEDYDLLFRWYSLGFRMMGIDEVTHFWREHPMRTSRNSNDYSQERFFDLKIRRFIRLDLNEKLLILNGTGTKGRLTARILIDNEIPFEWVSIEPEKFRAGVYGAEIKGVADVLARNNMQILNASSIDRKEVGNLYAEKNSISRIIQL